MKKLVIGILAHVDAGKTTLSEGMLYESGSIRKIGRVDNRDAFLDTYELERARGITIFSKQAVINLQDIQVTLLDTPGHVDFSAEMERTLQVMDYAILVISGSDGVQAHTQTLWYLLAKYKIPVFLFINKMDQPGANKAFLLKELRKKLGDTCIDFSTPDTDSFYESIAMSHEAMLDYFLETGLIELDKIKRLIASRTIFPCFFGSALKLNGVSEFLQGLETYVRIPQYPDDFGARIFKIARDERGNRLTYLKVTGGILKVRMTLEESDRADGRTDGRTSGGISGRTGEDVLPDKINQIRIYSGERYEIVSEAAAGTICAVTGPDRTYPGEGIGIESGDNAPILLPVLMYRLQLPDGCKPAVILPKLRQLEEEEPALHLVWNEALQEIQCQIMGEVQIEILKSMIQERFHVEALFDEGNIVYRETIADAVIGVGHFEPLRHYAEVQLLLESGEPGSGLIFAERCSVDVLERNWQRLILTHLKEREHRGVLTGSPITDMKITLLAGRAHKAHTEGGDFRQATYRAVRQGLKKAQSVLLEPYYKFRLELPEKMVGHAMTDLKNMYGSFEAPECLNGLAVLTGLAPVSAIRNYQKEFLSYTKGEGKLSLMVDGYGPCHNAEEVIEQAAYDSEKDLDNPTGSVFCTHGAGFTVAWDKVKDYQHLENVLKANDNLLKAGDSEAADPSAQSSSGFKPQIQDKWIADDEVEKIFARTFYANSQDKTAGRKKYLSKNQRIFAPSPATSVVSVKKAEARDEYLLVDGYNIIFAWEDLKELAKVNIDGARGRLLDLLCNYQALKKCRLIVVFDAYRVEGHQTEILEYHNIHVVYTKEAETADQYIEKFAYQNGRKYNITVATSDGLEQIIIRSQGCLILSAGDFLLEVKQVCEKMREEYLDRQPTGRSYMLDSLSDEEVKQVRDMLE